MLPWTLNIDSRPPRIALQPPRHREPQRIWRGAAARRLQATLGLQPGRHRCDKTALRRLWLAAAAAEMDTEQENEAMLDMTDTELARRLRLHRIPPTRQRLCVARALFTGPRAHFTAEDILERVCRREQGCSRATVYNTLRLFSAQGLIKALVVDAERSYYDTVTTPHAHLYHLDSGRLDDLRLDGLREALAAAVPAHLEVVDAHVVVQVRSADPAPGDTPADVLE